MNIKQRILGNVDLENDMTVFDATFATGEDEVVECSTEADVQSASAATASLANAMSALSITKDILEGSLKEGGVQEEGGQAVGVVMLMAEDAGIPVVEKGLPAMESYGVTDTRINATKFAMESLVDTIKSGAKKLWEALLRLIDKIVGFFKQQRPVEKAKVKEIKAAITAKKILQVKTPVVGNTLTDVFYFPLDISKNLIASINKISAILDKKNSPAVLFQDTENEYMVIVNDVKRALKESCRVDYDMMKPLLGQLTFKEKKVVGTANEYDKVLKYIEVIDRRNDEAHTSVYDLKAKIDKISKDDESQTGPLAASVTRSINLVYSILNVTKLSKTVIAVKDVELTMENDDVTLSTAKFPEGLLDRNVLTDQLSGVVTLEGDVTIDDEAMKTLIGLREEIFALEDAMTMESQAVIPNPYAIFIPEQIEAKRQELENKWNDLVQM